MVFQNLMGKLFPSEDPTEAIKTVEHLAETDPDAAEKKLFKTVKSDPGRFQLGGDLSGKMLAMVERIDAKLNAGSNSKLAEISVLSPDGDSFFDLKGLIEAARQEHSPLVSVTWDPAHQTVPWNQAKALRILRDHEQVTLVCIGEEGLICRREFLAHLDPTHPDSEEIAQELIDEANRQNLKAEFV